MNADKYVELAQRTSAPTFFDKKVPFPLLLQILEGVKVCAEKADVQKKAIFYGKRPDKSDAPDTAHSESLYGRDLSLTEREKRQFHAIIGVITEAGELAEILLNRLTGVTAEMDAAHIGEEMGDVLWYVAESAANGTPMSRMMTTNIEKLRVRFPNKFDAEDAAFRDLDAEGKVLGKVALSR